MGRRRGPGGAHAGKGRVAGPAREKRGGHPRLQRGVLGVIQDEWRKKGVFLEGFKAFDTSKEAVFASLISLDAELIDT